MSSAAQNVTFVSATQDAVITYTTNESLVAITAAAGEGAAISPSGTTNVVKGANQTCYLSVLSGYVLKDVTADGVNVGAAASYTFPHVTGIHTISASFKAESGATPPEIITTALRTGTVNVPCEETLKATGDTPVNWSLESTLPAGLSRNRSMDVLSGTPTEKNHNVCGIGIQ